MKRTMAITLILGFGWHHAYSQDTLQTVRKKYVVFLCQENTNCINSLKSKNIVDSNAVLGLNLGAEKRWLLTEYIKNGRITYIDGEDYLGYRQSYYDDFASQLKVLFFDSEVSVIGTNPIEGSIQGKFEVLKMLIKSNGKTPEETQLVDSLRACDFFYSGDYLVSLTNYFLETLNDTSTVQHIFRKNTECVLLILDELRILVLKYQEKEMNDMLKDYYRKNILETPKDVVILLNPSQSLMRFLENEDMIIYVNQNDFKKKAYTNLQEYLSKVYRQDQIVIENW